MIEHDNSMISPVDYYLDNFICSNDSDFVLQHYGQSVTTELPLLQLILRTEDFF